MGKARRATSVAALATVLLISMSACRGAQNVDDLARVLAKGSSHSEGQLAQDLKAANGGKSKLSPELAEGFDSNKAVEALVDAGKEAASLACKAWEIGGEQVVTTPQTSLLVYAEASGILGKMRAETDGPKIAAIDAACNFESVVSTGF